MMANSARAVHVLGKRGVMVADERRLFVRCHLSAVRAKIDPAACRLEVKGLVKTREPPAFRPESFQTGYGPS
ncbi:MAG: hypothetical protein V4726_19930 [Verrucomicrobiota bacterium]